MRIIKTLSLLLFLSLLAACVYRQDIPQGNYLEEEDIEEIEVGMTRSQVQFLLGTPMLKTPFHSDRWLYHYYLDSRRAHRNYRRDLAIHFDGEGRVSEIRDSQASDS